MFKERQFAISNDNTGVLGTEKSWIKTWGFVLGQENFQGIEAIGWLWAPLLVSRYQSYGIDVVGIHGKTGGIKQGKDFLDKIKLFGGDKILISNKNLIRNKADIKYILLHAPQAKNLNNKELDNFKKTFPRILFIENHLGFGALEAAKKTAIDLKKKGVNSGIMIDFCHITTTEMNHLENFHKSWDSTMELVIKQIDEALKFDPNFPIGFHIPIGDGEGLPWDLMTKPKWKDLRNLYVRYPEIFTVVENQQHFPDFIYLTKEAIKKQKETNKQRFAVLAENEVLIAK